MTKHFKRTEMKGSLIGKYVLHSPNLENSIMNINDYKQQFVINHQTKIMAQYKNIDGELHRDGFSLLID